MKYILSLIIGGALVVSGFGQTRNVLVGTNNAVVQPTNFWSADASNARTGLGLGTAATSPATAFQPASSSLTNLASGNGGALTNLQATNLIGIIPASNISTVNFTNIGGTLSIASGGTGATNAADARQNLGSTTVGDAVFIATNAAAARTAIGAIATNGDAINLTNFPTLLLRTNGNGAGLTNLTAANIMGTVALASNLSSPLALTNGGTGATNAATARTNLGFTVIGDSLVTASSAEAALDVLGISTNYSNTVLSVSNLKVTSFPIGSSFGFVVPTSGQTLVVAGTNVTSTIPAFFGFDGFSATAFSAAQARTNIGLTLPALTNTNNANFLAAFFGANTNPVLVDTNGEVVSPTNFWQAAPITTTFIESQPTTNFTTNITASRFLHIHSLNTNIVNVTNTIALPTNGSTYNGDIALVVHQGPTNSMTRVRAAGSTNDIATMTRYNEAIEFVYYNNTWQFNHNQAFTEPIYFAGTNAVTHAAESRTNLGLGATWLTNNNVTNFRTAIDLGETNAVDFGVLTISNSGAMSLRGEAGALFFWDSIDEERVLFIPSDTDPVEINSQWNNAGVRSNLGLSLAALTNTSNTNFQAAVFNTNTAPTNTANVNGIGFNTVVHWMEVTVQTNGTNATFRIPLFQ